MKVLLFLNEGEFLMSASEQLAEVQPFHDPHKIPAKVWETADAVIATYKLTSHTEVVPCFDFAHNDVCNGAIFLPNDEWVRVVHERKPPFLASKTNTDGTALFFLPFGRFFLVTVHEFGLGVLSKLLLSKSTRQLPDPRFNVKQGNPYDFQYYEMNW